MSDMRRREFITLLGGAAAWPLVVRAQQPMSVIGFLSGASADGYGIPARAFRQGLKDTGYVEGQNVGIEYRWAEGQYDRLPSLATELVQQKVTVIAATTTPAALAAKAATSTVPIVLVNPANPLAATVSKDLQAVADTLGLRLHVLHASTEADFETAFATAAQLRAAALVISTPDPWFNSHAAQLGALALRHSVPAIFQYRAFAAAGGLMSYGSVITDTYRLAGVYAGRILKGEKPADMPVQQATKVELYINMKTARALGVTIPLPLSGRADEIFE